ncbi:hypothetical protein NVP1244A_201 [Vibrio phage 1.244.A._10N.261.54.C3]|nr:hypothetical protein NVP1244A_201 [Vibrio phage 1.244.A._10N.261.54.C3]AUR98829.1 hypothetical protein NVP1255O_201 [Vibrio phage 1.255.O._10N.286.45.F1]
MKRNITNADYDGIVAGIRRLAKTDPNFKDFDFDGSGLSSIIRLLALQGNQQAFTSNMMFNEGFLKTAEMRENVGSAASFLSYVPGSKRGAEMYVDITVTPPSTATPLQEITLRKTDVFLGVMDGQTFNFSPLENITTPLTGGAYKFSGVRLVQGVWATNTYDVQGVAIDSYVIPNADIDIETLDVGVIEDVTTQKSTTFRRYRSAYDLGATEKLFFLQLNRNGLYEIEFGDGVLSKQVNDGNIAVVNYMVTKGETANGITDLTPASIIGGYPNVTLEVKSNATGGSEVESIESIKHTAPLAVGRNGSAVTDTDYVVKTKELYPSAAITSWGGENNTPPLHGYTIVAIKDASGNNLTADAKNALVAYLRQFNVGSVTPKIIDGEELLINVTSDVYWNPAATNVKSSAMKTQVTNSLRGWSKDKLQNFNTQFDLGMMSTFITDSDLSIRTNVTTVSYEKRYNVPDVTAQQPQSLYFNKSIQSGSVRMSGFTMPPRDPSVAADYSYYAHDSNSDGNVYIFENKSGIVRQYSEEPIASVDYTTGVVLVNPTKFTSVSEFVSVKCSSSTTNQNLDTVRGQILKLGSIGINMKVG